MREPGQRHRAQPRADRAGERGGAGGDAGRDVCAARCRRAMLTLRRGVVVEAGDPGGALQRVGSRWTASAAPPRSDAALLGACREGDEVVVNVAARDLGLGSGGFDVVHVNLTRGLEGEGVAGAHVMKLNYTSLQHAVEPVEGEDLEVPLGRPAAVFGLHGQLAPLAWAFAQAAGAGARLGYVQTAGGALPGSLSRVVRELRERGLLAGHLTAGAGVRRRGRGDQHRGRGAPRPGRGGLGRRRVRPGPGHPGLGVGAGPRRDGGAGLRPRRAGARLPHAGGGAHVLRRPARSATAASPTTPARCSSCCWRRWWWRCPRTPRRKLTGWASWGPGDRHDVRRVEVDLDGYAATGLPARTMGRDLRRGPAVLRRRAGGGRGAGGRWCNP